MSPAPDEVHRLAEERERARAARDYAAADSLRERIRELGFEVADTPDGPRLAPAEGPGGGSSAERATLARPDEVPSLLDRPPTCDASVQWIVEGWPEDVLRGIESFRRGSGTSTVRHVVVDVAGADPRGWPEGTDLVRLGGGIGWAAARNAGLRRADGGIVVLVDGSVEARGEVIGSLMDALRDPTVGVTGPFGILSEDLREFRESAGPDVDAVEGYLMAFRRDVFERGIRFDERFRFYRTADIELSFQVKALGLRATVTAVPVIRHEHRVWHATPEEDRARLSKRNFYRFLDRWRGRTDLLVSRGGPGSPQSPPTPRRPPPSGTR